MTEFIIGLAIGGGAALVLVIVVLVIGFMGWMDRGSH